MYDSYAARRQHVLQAIHPGVLIVAASSSVLRNGDVAFDYRQDSDFYYLTGLEEPGSVLVLASSTEKPFTLFVLPRDPRQEAFDGPRVGIEGAIRDFGADQAWPHSELTSQLRELLKNRSRLFYRLGRNRNLDDTILGAIADLRSRNRKGAWWPSEIIDPELALHEIRLLKSSAEVDRIRRAASITGEAIVAAMGQTRPGQHEYEVEALIRATFRRLGAERAAFEPIVAAGSNATILHYRRNSCVIRPDDLVLLDVGCEWQYYAGDITRTFPASGRFTASQARLYELVLRAQEAAIDSVRPGVTLDQVHEAALRPMTEGLIELGILAGPVDEALTQKRYQPFFMHRTSHYLGMDVHDVGRYHHEGTARSLEAGMVITVEPGVYFQENADAPPDCRGIGIRIEDDVLVTPDGHSVLSAEIPKRLADVELACSR
ncbi:aminopeptidase P N-terminal domain-containing protein [Myxococcota bacterium]